VKLARRKINTGQYQLVDSVNPHQVYATAYLGADKKWHWFLVEGLEFKGGQARRGEYDLLVLVINKVSSMINQYGVKFPEEEK
jgi:hypothetical protein